MNVCLTNKTRRVNTRAGRPIFDVNTKLAAGTYIISNISCFCAKILKNTLDLLNIAKYCPVGMLHAGMGPTHVNALLTSLNVPAVGANTIKAREREIGSAVEKIAKRSCTEALAAEKECWRNDDSEGPVAIGSSYDMGWQKRGKGHNSLTGTLINII